MNWYDIAEEKRTLIKVGLIIVCLAVLLVTTRLHNISADSYWHLKMGLDWLNHGSSFWVDQYSYTFEGKDISSPPFIFEMTLAWLVTQFGLVSGYELFKLLSFVLTFSLVIYFLAKLKASSIIYLLVLPVLVGLLQMRALVRPELISYSFSVLAIILYHRANNRIAFTTLFPIALLMLVWGNYHSPVFGYVIFFGFFIDAGFHQIRNNCPTSTWVKWLLWGMVIVAIGFINPGFNHPILSALSFDPAWKNEILEYQSSSIYLMVPGFYSLIVLSVATIILLFQRKYIGLLISCLICCFYAATVSRLVTPAGIIILCVFAWQAAEVDLKKLFQNKSMVYSKLAGITATLVFLAALFSAIVTSRAHMQQNALGTPFPVDVVDYMAENNIGGNVFNEYAIGGYLIYRLFPSVKVYIDGRTGILYPLEHYYQYKSARLLSSELKSEIDKYEINLAILSNSFNNFSILESASDFNLDFVGGGYSLFKRGKSNFPTMGTLLANPACLKKEMAPNLMEELVKTKSLLPKHSLLTPELISYLIDYNNAPDKAKFIEAQEITEKWSSIKMRFTAYWALESGFESLSNFLFTQIESEVFTDYLGASLAQIHLEEWKTAEQTLDRATRVSASDNPKVIELLYRLLKHIQNHHTLEYFDNAYINGLIPDNVDSTSINQSVLPNVTDFCF